MNANIFELATKQKLRFGTNRGQVGVEDLWDLSLEELDKIAGGLDEELKKTSGKSFIRKQNTVDKKVSLKLDVVVSVINTKLEEDEKRKLIADRKAKRNQLLELIAAKENDVLSRKSITALRAEYEKLEEEEVA